jgi:glycosyltransferase involved in cell wall biosynthesis
VKILLLHQHFKTPQRGGAIRSFYLAKALVDRGIQTIVITAHNEKHYKTEHIEGIEVHYLPVAYDNRFGFYKRTRSFLHFVGKVVTCASKFKDAKGCYAISVPLTIGIAAWWIKLRYKIPYVFEVGDLWPEAPIQMGFVKNKLFQQSLYALEKFIYRGANAIVALSPAIQSAIEKKVRHKQIYQLPNMADTDFYKPSIKQPALEKKFSVQNKFVVSYIGAIGIANGLDYFLECARTSQRANLPIHFIMCGDGAMQEGLKKFSKQLELKNISILPFRNRDGVCEILNITDASFICYKPVKVLETGSPNKYFDGLAAGKLMIINFGGWIKEEIERERCGVVVEAQHPTDFVKKIAPFLENRTLLEEYQKSARALAEKKYSRNMLSEHFAEIIKHTM